MPAGVARLATTGTRDRLGEEPWPPGVSIEDDEALRVSSVLAGRDVAAAVDGAGRSTPRSSGGRVAPRPAPRTCSCCVTRSRRPRSRRLTAAVAPAACCTTIDPRRGSGGRAAR